MTTSPPLVPLYQPQPQKGTNLWDIAKVAAAPFMGPIGPIAVSAVEWFVNLF